MPRELNPWRRCPDCGVLHDRYYSAPRCLTCANNRVRTTYHPPGINARAVQEVQKAVKRGELKKLDGSVPCTDCGEPAKCYDHRDYSKPLDVEPVCVGCNNRRGPSKGFIG